MAGFRFRKKRSTIERQARDAAYMTLIDNPTDLAIEQYIKTSFGEKTELDTVVACRYVLGLVENSSDQMKVSTFRDTMDAWFSDKEQYSILVTELENELIGAQQ